MMSVFRFLNLVSICANIVFTKSALINSTALMGTYANVANFGKQARVSEARSSGQSLYTQR